MLPISSRTVEPCSTVNTVDAVCKSARGVVLVTMKACVEGGNPKTPQLIVAKICVRDYVRDSYQSAKFHPDRISGFVSAHARLCTPLCVGCVFRFFVSSNRLQQRRAHRFFSKYIERRGSAQECAFWGCQTGT